VTNKSILFLTVLVNQAMVRIKKKRKAIRHHQPNVEKLASNLLNVFEGKDATVISGITDYSWMQLLAETGSDLTKWPTEKHFTYRKIFYKLVGSCSGTAQLG